MKAPERREFKGMCETEKRDVNKQIKKIIGIINILKKYRTRNYKKNRYVSILHSEIFIFI